MFRRCVPRSPESKGRPGHQHQNRGKVSGRRLQGGRPGSRREQAELLHECGCGPRATVCPGAISPLPAPSHGFCGRQSEFSPVLVSAVKRGFLPSSRAHPVRELSPMKTASLAKKEKILKSQQSVQTLHRPEHKRGPLTRYMILWFRFGVYTQNDSRVSKRYLFVHDSIIHK